MSKELVFKGEALASSVTLRKDTAGLELEEEAAPVAGTGTVVMVGESSQRDRQSKAEKGEEEKI